jgi:hypothetical protein
MDGLCGASPRKRRTIVALDPKTRKAPFFGYFLWQDKESDPAACGRKLLMLAGRHSLLREKHKQHQNGFRLSPE